MRKRTTDSLVGATTSFPAAPPPEYALDRFSDPVNVSFHTFENLTGAIHTNISYIVWMLLVNEYKAVHNIRAASLR